MVDTITKVELVPTITSDEAFSELAGAIFVQGNGGEVAMVARCGDAIKMDRVLDLVDLQRKVGPALDKSPVNGARIIGAIYAYKVLGNIDAEQAWEYTQIIRKFSDLETFFAYVKQGTDKLDNELHLVGVMKTIAADRAALNYRQPANIKKRFAKELDKLGLTPEQYLETVQ
jgi:hypothetical protein